MQTVQRYFIQMHWKTRRLPTQKQKTYLHVKSLDFTDAYYLSNKKSISQLRANNITWTLLIRESDVPIEDFRGFNAWIAAAGLFTTANSLSNFHSSENVMLETDFS